MVSVSVRQPTDGQTGVIGNVHGCSSVGRALVSKTRCREFESLLPC